MIHVRLAIYCLLWLMVLAITYGLNLLILTVIGSLWLAIALMAIQMLIFWAIFYTKVRLA